MVNNQVQKCSSSNAMDCPSVDMFFWDYKKVSGGIKAIRRSGISDQGCVWGEMNSLSFNLECNSLLQQTNCVR